MPGQMERRRSVRRKLNAIGLEFEGKNVLLVDDSIVRGTTSQQIIRQARDAGARRVYFASAAPPVRYQNVYGIDMPVAGELIAFDRDEGDVARAIGADRLFYQSMDGLVDAVRRGNPRLREFGHLVLHRRVRHRRRIPELPGADRGAPRRLRQARPRGCGDRP